MSKTISYNSNYFFIKDEGVSIAEIKYSLGIPDDTHYCDDSNYFFYELYNYYFSNSQDIYEIYQDNQDEAIGYVFPIQILDGDEELTDKWKKICLYTTAQWILKNKDVEGTKSFLNIYGIEEKQISEENTTIPIIMIINKKTAPNFDIQSSRLSLLLNGYSSNKDCKLKNISRTDFFFENKSKLKLTACQTNNEPELEKILFSDLLYTDNVAYKFLIIYQSFEYFMKIEQKKKNDLIKSEFSSLDLMDFKTLRDFKKSIQELDNEKILLKSAFKDVELQEEFHDDDTFFSDIFSDILQFSDSETLYLKIYNVRNTLFHYYRNFFNNPKFDRLLFLTYQMLIELLISKLNTK